MTQHQIYLQRCLELAQQGIRKVAPNPMVGAVIVYKGRIIGEGFHEQYGGPHAEVNAIRSVKPADRNLLSSATLYVNLEPCSHYGQTPPCADLVVRTQIPKVIVGCLDPNPKVAGRGIKKLQAAGIEVITHVLEKESKWLNRRFMVWMREKRPYVILKWAQTQDGFFAPKDGQQKWISHALSKKTVHKWRTEEQAILVGTNTAASDNPQLTARLWAGSSPTRLLIDRNLRLPQHLHLFDGTIPTVVFTEKKQENRTNLIFEQIDFSTNILPQILSYCYKQKIQSILVEGGTQVLQSFIASELWDEARIFTSPQIWNEGLPAPKLRDVDLVSREVLARDELGVFIRAKAL